MQYIFRNLVRYICTYAVTVKCKGVKNALARCVFRVILLYNSRLKIYIAFFARVCYTFFVNFILSLRGLFQMIHGQNAAFIKQENIRLTLDVIERHQPLSRTDIAALTDISPASITRIVGALMRCGLVRENESIATGQRGRKAIRLSMRNDGMYTSGVCVEASRLLVCVIDVSREVKAIMEVPFGIKNPTPDDIARLARKALSDMPFADKLSAVGLSVAGIVDTASGLVARSDQMCWENAALGDAFSNALGVRAWVENDVKACLIGEKQRMGTDEDDDIAYILIGTGVGVAAFCNGSLVRGISNEAGEIEHLPFPCGDDTLSAHLIEENLIARAREADPSVRDLNDILAARDLKIRWADLLVNDFKSHLCFAVGLVNGLFNPKTIVLGGSIIPRIAPLIRDLTENGRVKLGEDYDYACAMGAAQLCMRHAIHALIKEESENAE